MAPLRSDLSSQIRHWHYSEKREEFLIPTTNNANNNANDNCEAGETQSKNAFIDSRHNNWLSRRKSMATVSFPSNLIVIISVMCAILLSVCCGGADGSTAPAPASVVKDPSECPPNVLGPSVGTVGGSPQSRDKEHGFGFDDHEVHEIHRLRVASVDFEHVQTPFIIALWIFLASLSKIGFHMANKLSSIFPESCLLIFVGVIIGLLLFYTRLTSVSPLTPDSFFLYMLPPIVLDAGYFMPNRLFFDNLGTILLFAVVGTVWNTLTIGLSLWAVGLTGLFGVTLTVLDSFLFSALISAVDPVAVLAVFEEIQVNEVLYIVVFGESLLNDAVTVVLYHMFESYTEMGVSNIEYTDVLSGFGSFFVVAIGGTAVGVFWGYMCAFVTRFTNHVRVIEPVFVFVMSYLAYLNAEMFHFSGILAITFCGICMKNYVEANISKKSHTTVKYAMKMIASSSETIIFMFLGVATVNDDHDWNTWFVLFTILFCTVYRAIGVVVLTGFANHFRVHKLNKVEEFVMAYGGLRGAVAFALALTISQHVVDHKHMFVTTTIAVVYFTVFIQGITIKPLVNILGVKKSEKRKVTMNERIHERFMDHLMAGIEDIVGHHGNYHLRDKFKYYDNKYLRRWLVRDHKTNDPKILETFSKLNLKDAMNMVHQSNMCLPQITATEYSLASLFRSYTNANLNNQSQSQGSLPRNDSSAWNLDLKEFNYSPSGKDLNDVNLHHILSDAMFKPVKRHRKYSRSQIHEPESHPPFHHKMRLQIRHVLSEQNRHRRLRQKKHNGHVGSANGHSSGGGSGECSDEIEKPRTPPPTQNGSAQLAYAVVYPEDEEGIVFAAQPGREDGVITFTVRGSSRGAASSSPSPLTPPVRARPSSLMISGDDDSRATSTQAIPSRAPSPPPPQTATEAQLPWKRNDADSVGMSGNGGAVRQQEFPSWIDNKDYISYASPTSTFLGGLNGGIPTRTPVFDLFDRAEEAMTRPPDLETILEMNVPDQGDLDDDSDEGHFHLELDDPDPLGAGAVPLSEDDTTLILPQSSAGRGVGVTHSDGRDRGSTISTAISMVGDRVTKL